VVQERKHGRVIHVTTRVVYGTLAQVKAALQASPVSRTITTYGVERHNLTVRQHARRLGRKVNAFSKEPDYLAHPRTLAFAYDHFVVSPPQFTATSAPYPPDQRTARVAEAMDASDPRYGSWSDRPCVDHG
jgi:hypothetical protein